MKRIIAGTLLILCIPFLLTACWDRQELNDVSITMAIGFDKVGDQVKISVQIVNPDEVAGKQSTTFGVPATMYTETADTVIEATRTVTSKMPRLFYVGHLRMLKGDTAENMLRVFTIPQESIPAEKLFKSLKSANRMTAEITSTTLHEVLFDILTDGINPSVPGVIKTGQKHEDIVETKENIERLKPVSSLKFKNMAAFRHDKLVGWLKDEEASGLKFILNKERNSVYKIACPDGYLVLESIRADTQVKAEVKNGQPRIKIQVHTEDDVIESECKLNLRKEQTFFELEQKQERLIHDLIEKTIQKAQTELHSDILGFGMAVHRADPKAWAKLKQNWDETAFRELPVQIDVDVKIRRQGMVLQSLPTEIKE